MHVQRSFDKQVRLIELDFQPDVRTGKLSSSEMEFQCRG